MPLSVNKQLKMLRKLWHFTAFSPWRTVHTVASLPYLAEWPCHAKTTRRTQKTSVRRPHVQPCANRPHVHLEYRGLSVCLILILTGQCAPWLHVPVPPRDRAREKYFGKQKHGRVSWTCTTCLSVCVTEKIWKTETKPCLMCM